MPLFIPEPFTSHSGLRLDWKIDCDALTDGEIEALAQITYRHHPLFRKAYGVPNGGLRLAKALHRYERNESDVELIIDDVLTTGASMEEFRRVVQKISAAEFVGVVIFARGPCPDWVYPIFRVEDWVRR